MKESEMKAGSSEARKEKIRKSYKGIDPDELYVVPAVPGDNFFDSETEKRVAVYARVYTDDPNQTSSYEMQKIHYLDMHPSIDLIILRKFILKSFSAYSLVALRITILASLLVSYP